MSNARNWLNDWLWKTDTREVYDGPIIPEVKALMVLACEAYAAEVTKPAPQPTSAVRCFRYSDGLWAMTSEREGKVLDLTLRTIRRPASCLSGIVQLETPE